MAFCSFDEGAALFDSTPVDNMFINEYMIHASGEHVKVYLYALMLCYHDSQGMSLSRMAKDLGKTEEEIESAFSYWARQGLVRKTGDNPVKYVLRNVRQMTLMRAENPAEQLYDRQFADEIHRRLEGLAYDERYLQTVFDWVDKLELSKEAVLMLLEMEAERVKKRGTRFSFYIADKRAQEWASSGVRTEEDVKRIISLDKERELELRRLLSRLGQRRNPSDDEKAMYNKWRDEWGFEEEAIQAACRETTKGVPTMAYLDSILLRQHQLGRHGAQAIASGMARDYSERDFAREVFSGLGRMGMSPTPEDMAAIAEWIADGFSQPMILLAVREAHAKGGGSLEDVAVWLTKWRKEGLASPEQVSAARARVRMLNAQLREVYAMAGLEKRVNQADRDLLAKWAGEMGMGMELILLAAQYARGNGAAMLFADRILADWHRAGIDTEQAARAEHEAHVQGRKGNGTQGGDASMLRHTPEERRATYSAAVVNLDEEDDA